MLLRIRCGPDGVVLDIAMGDSDMTGAVTHMVVRKMNPSKAKNGIGECGREEHVLDVAASGTIVG